MSEAIAGMPIESEFPELPREPGGERGADLEALIRAARLLLAPDTVAELRILEVDGVSKNTWAGFFHNPRRLAEAALEFDGRAKGIYVTLNPVRPELLERATQRLIRARNGELSQDPDVVRRRSLLFDFDPNRKSDVSSTDAEHAAAIERARAAREWLTREFGFGPCVLADSGNGAHVVYRIDLPNDDEARELVRRCLQAVDFRFGDDLVGVDVGIFNAARICKLYETMARKGENTPERPHRRSRILEAPAEFEAQPREVLERLAETLPVETPALRTSRSGTVFDLERFIAEHALDVGEARPWKDGGRKWIFRRCPRNPEHTDHSAYLAQQPSGAIVAGCLHASCKGFGWAELREMYEPARNRGARPSASKSNGEHAASESVAATDPRPEICIRKEIPHLLASAAEAAILEHAPGRVFQKIGTLVRVVREGAPRVKGLKRPEGQPVIGLLPEVSLYELAAQSAQWKSYSRQRKQWEADGPSSIAIKILANRAERSFPYLAAIAEAPIYRPDGTILQTPGYDPQTSTLYIPNADFPEIPEHPSRADAGRALLELAEPFCQFPFRDGASRSAFLAGILTQFALLAIDAAVPWLVIIKNVPGTGGSLAADSIAIIATGRPAARLTLTPDITELRKLLFTIAIEATPIALFDDLEAIVGNSVLSNVLTSGTIRDRLLGINKTATVPFRTMLVGTGNGTAFRRDTVRRVSACHLFTTEEHPEDRSGFLHPDLKGYLLEERPRLVAAALTVLRGFRVAGCPAHGKPAKGSFEAWDALIRGALLWLGEPDPRDTEEELRAEGDADLEALRNALDAWESAFGRVPRTTSEAVRAARESRTDPTLRDALAAIAGCRGDELTSSLLGYAFRRYAGRPCDGRAFMKARAYEGGSSTRTRQWTIDDVKSVAEAGS